MVSLCRNFLWSGKSFIHKRPLVSWRNICLPKTEGGLGIKCPHNWNKALLSTALWNVQAKKDTLWVRWVNHHYLKGSSLWDCQINKLDSTLWKHLLTIRDEILTKEGSKQSAQQKLLSWSAQDKFDTKLPYDYFRNRGQRVIWHTVVWNSAILPKHAFNYWLAMKGKLKTSDKLPSDNLGCCLCQLVDETADHLFFACPITSQIWNSVRAWLGISRRMSTIKAATKWLLKEGRGTGIQPKVRKIAFAATLYHIWQTRNMVKFEGKGCNSNAVVRKIQVQVYRVLSFLFPHLFG